MLIKIFYSNGSTAQDRGRDMMLAEERAKEWANLDRVSYVEIHHCQQLLATYQGKD